MLLAHHVEQRCYKINASSAPDPGSFSRLRSARYHARPAGGAPGARQGGSQAGIYFSGISVARGGATFAGARLELLCFEHCAPWHP